jgi:hypothetical protein
MTARDSITRTRARTPEAEDDPTSTTVRDRVLGPTQCGISDVATKCTKGGRKPNICRCMLGAVLSWRCLGRHRLKCQPCSRIGENPPYGMIGGIEETSASSKPDPRLDPTRLDEVALIRNTISHYAPMLIRTLSIPRVPLRGMNFFNGLASPALRQSRCGDRRAEPSRQLSGIIFIDTALGSVRTTRGVT